MLNGGCAVEIEGEAKAYLSVSFFFFFILNSLEVREIGGIYLSRLDSLDLFSRFLLVFFERFYLQCLSAFIARYELG